MIGVGTRFSDFTTASKWIFQHPEVRFLNINVSNFDARKLDGIAMLADAREAMTALDAALADSGWQAGWGAQIESVQSRQLKRPSASTGRCGRRNPLCRRSTIISIVNRCIASSARSPTPP
nr:3D-(3,5/4)-trihydroxycyclohexane-1,2-dione hydrolase [Klebsiella pneumoniae]